MKKTLFTIVLLLLGALNSTAARGATLSHLTDKLAVVPQPNSTAHVTMKVGRLVWDLGQVSDADQSRMINASLSAAQLATLAGYTQPSITETLDAGSLLATTTWSPQNTYAGGVTGLGFRLEAFLWDTTSHNGYLAGTFFTSVAVPEPSLTAPVVLLVFAWAGIWYFGRRDHV